MPKTSPKDIEYKNLLKAAVKLRAEGIWYSEIIEKLGHWNSISACQKAVAKALSADFDNTVEAARNEIVCRNETRISRLMDKFDKNNSVIVSREISRINDQIAKLKGLYAPTKLAHEGRDGDDIGFTLTIRDETEKDETEKPDR